MSTPTSAPSHLGHPGLIRRWLDHLPFAATGEQEDAKRFDYLIAGMQLQLAGVGGMVLDDSALGPDWDKGRTKIVGADCHVIEDCGAARGEALAEAVPVVDHRNASRLRGHDHDDRLLAMVGRHADPVGIIGARSIVFASVELEAGSGLSHDGLEGAMMRRTGLGMGRREPVAGRGALEPTVAPSRILALEKRFDEADMTAQDLHDAIAVQPAVRGVFP